MPFLLLLSICILWLFWAYLSRDLTRTPQRPGDPLCGLFMLILRPYALFFHRTRYLGLENIPHHHPGPLIVVANHTAGIDPLLIQAVCPFEIRWMMGRDMMIPALKPLWDWANLIPVDRNTSSPRGDTIALRAALNHLATSAVLGIFPQGGISHPPHHKPFAPGVGLLIHRTSAPVLQVLISDTPPTPPAPPASSAFRSLFTPSRPTVRFLPITNYADSGLKPAQIVQDLESRMNAQLPQPATPDHVAEYDYKTP